jgi:hypothetical protein
LPAQIAFAEIHPATWLIVPLRTSRLPMSNNVTINRPD